MAVKHVCLNKDIKDIFSLTKEESITRSSNLDTEKVLAVSVIFYLKFLLNKGLISHNSFVIIIGDNNVINIEYQNDHFTMSMSKVITLTPFHSKLVRNM